MPRVHFLFSKTDSNTYDFCMCPNMTLVHFLFLCDAEAYLDRKYYEKDMKEILQEHPDYLDENVLPHLQNDKKYIDMIDEIQDYDLIVIDKNCPPLLVFSQGGAKFVKICNDNIIPHQILPFISQNKIKTREELIASYEVPKEVKLSIAGVCAKTSILKKSQKVTNTIIFCDPTALHEAKFVEEYKIGENIR